MCVDYFQDEKSINTVIKITFNEDELRFLKKIYSEGNRKIHEATGLDLSGKGYLI